MSADGSIERKFILPTPEPVHEPAGDLVVGKDSETAKVSETLKRDITEPISAESLAAIQAGAQDLSPEELDARVDEFMAKARAEMQKIEKVTAKIKHRQGQMGEIQTQVGKVDLPEQTRREPGAFALKVAEMQGKLGGMQEIIRVYEEERGARQKDVVPPSLPQAKGSPTVVGLPGRENRVPTPWTDEQKEPRYDLTSDEFIEVTGNSKDERSLENSPILPHKMTEAEKKIERYSGQIRERGYGLLLTQTINEYRVAEEQMKQLNRLAEQGDAAAAQKALLEKERLLELEHQVNYLNDQLDLKEGESVTPLEQARRDLLSIEGRHQVLVQELENVGSIDHADAQPIVQKLEMLEGEKIKKQQEIDYLQNKEDFVLINNQYDALEQKLVVATKAKDSALIAQYQKELQATADRLTFIDARIKDREGSHVFDAGLSKTPSGEQVIKTAVGVGDKKVALQTKKAATTESWFIPDKEEPEAVKPMSKRRGLFGGLASALVTLGVRAAELFGGHHEVVEKPESAAAVKVALPEAQSAFATVEKAIEIKKDLTASVAAPENLPVGTTDLRPTVDTDRIMKVIHKKVPIRGKTIADLPAKATGQVQKTEKSAPSVTEQKGIFGEIKPSELDNLDLDELVKDAEKKAIKNVVKRHVDKAFAKIDLGFVEAINQVGEDAEERIGRNERLPQKYIEQLASYSVESLDQFIDNAKKEVARLKAESATPENLKKLGEARTYLDALKDARKIAAKKPVPSIAVAQPTGSGVPVENATSIPENTRKVPVAETTLPVDKGLREVVNMQNKLDSARRDWVNAVDMLAMTKGAHKSADEISEAEQAAETARVLYETLKKEALGQP